jgi:hypothetical protein
MGEKQHGGEKPDGGREAAHLPPGVTERDKPGADGHGGRRHGRNRLGQPARPHHGEAKDPGEQQQRNQGAHGAERYPLDHRLAACRFASPEKRLSAEIATKII